jgi:peptidoglycan/LPS O-acetylase OafA/YrhL
MTSERSTRLDAVRGIAAMMVVVSHATLIGMLNAPGTQAGSKFAFLFSSGIHLFFALSGYLIAGPYIRALISGEPLPSARRYFLRRAARIYPAYWVALTVILLIDPHPALSFKALFAHYSILHNEFPREATKLLFVAWTLGIEVLFYVFVPLVAHAVRRFYGERPLRAEAIAVGIGAMWAASVAWSLLTLEFVPGWRYLAPARLSLPNFLGQFCPGMLIAVAQAGVATSPTRWRRYRWLANRPVTAVALATPAVVVAFLLRTRSHHVVLQELPNLCYAVAAGLILLAFMNGGAITDRVTRVMAPLGIISYGIYLWHWVVVVTLKAHHARPAVGHGIGVFAINVVVLALLAIALGAASWFVVEKPLIDRAARWRPRSGVPAR